MTAYDGPLAVLRISDRRYGIPVLLVEEFFRPVPITPVPGSDPRIAGLINLRGASATVVDLRRTLGLPDRPGGESGHMLMLETADKLSPAAQAVGIAAPEDAVVLLVDRVEGIVPVREVACHPPPAHVGHPFAAGVYEQDGGYVTLLSVPAIIADILAAHPAPGGPTP